MAWPPTLSELKDDLAIPVDDTEDDAALTRRLNAAIRYVQRVRKDAFLTSDAGLVVEPVVFSLQGDAEHESLVLGTLMFAGRLFARRRSSDAILYMAETGTTHVPMADEDIARTLRIGRFARPKVG